MKSLAGQDRNFNYNLLNDEKFIKKIERKIKKQ